MCKNERRQIVMPPNVAFKEVGNPSLDIPPYATLIFDVELVDFHPAKDEL